MRLNLKAEVTEQQEAGVGVTEVCRDPAAAADGVAAGVGAAAGADAGTACAGAGAGGPALLPPQPQSGPRAPAPPQAPCHCSPLRPPPPPASVAAAVAAAAASSAVGTTSRTSGSRGWCSSRCGPPSLAGGLG